MASGSNHGHDTRQQRILQGAVAQSIDDVVDVGLGSNRSSSSNLSKCESVSDLPGFEDAVGTDRRGVEVSHYSLIDIATVLGVPHQAVFNEVTKDGRKQMNDKTAGACVQAICEQIDPNWEVVTNIEVPEMNKLPPFAAKPRQRSDVLVQLEGEVGFSAEVRSSPMLFTERKAIIGAADFLRLQRYKGHTEIDTITTFAFPNCDSKHCLIEVTVSFKQFLFVSRMKRYPNLTAGIQRLREVIEEQCTRIFRLQHKTPLPSHSLIQLSQEECDVLCSGSTQMQKSSQHIIVHSSDTVYKIVYSSTEQIALSGFIIELFTASTLGSTLPKFVILPVNVFRLFGKIQIYKYKKVKFGPLASSDAFKCLRALVEGIMKAMDELHDFGFSHNDLRLPNVCFNDLYEPVLIDIDRFWPVDRIQPMFTSSIGTSSCMYDFKGNFENGRQTDCFQLGWLVIWIIEQGVGDYHNREWEKQSSQIRGNKFVSTLIEEGKYKPSLLSSLENDTEDLRSVLSSREHS